MARMVLGFLSAAPIIFSFSLGCSASAPREAELEVAYYREPCTGEGSQFCLRVADPPGAPWTRFYDSIAGFDPKWGTSYRIHVEISDVVNPPADGSSLDYRLVEVVSHTIEPQTTEFSITFSTSEEPLLLTDSLGSLRLLDGPKLTCTDDAACQAARAWVAKPAGTLRLTLHNPADPGTELVVTASSTN